MGRRCCVPGCSNFDRSRTNAATYHRFPRNPELRQRWIETTLVEKIHAPAFKLTPNSCVCSAHFTKEDFLPLSLCRERTRLFASAVPSIFANNITGIMGSRNKQHYKKPLKRKSRKKKPPVEITEVNVEKIDATDENESLKRKLTEVNSDLEDHKILNHKMRRSMKELIKENEQLKTSSEEENPNDSNIEKLKLLAFNKIIHDDDLIQSYTGFVQSAAYRSFFRHLEIRARRHFAKVSPTAVSPFKIPHDVLSFEEMFFLTLLRLKLGFSARNLERIFAISVDSIDRIFTKWLNLLNFELRDWFSADRAKARSERTSTETTLMIDCIQFQTATLKALLAATPDGSVCFVSDIFDGSTSFRSVVEKSGFLNLLNEGHSLMTDKGFDISDLLPERLPIIIPSKCFQSESCSASELGGIAELDLDGIIGKVKTYLILDAHWPHSLSNVRKEILTACAMLCNFNRGFNAHAK